MSVPSRFVVASFRNLSIPAMTARRLGGNSPPPSAIGSHPRHRPFSDKSAVGSAAQRGAGKKGTKKTKKKKKSIPRSQLYVPPTEETTKKVAANASRAKSSASPPPKQSFLERMQDQPAYVILGVFPVAAMATLLMVNKEMREQAYGRWKTGGKSDEWTPEPTYVEGQEKGLVNVHNDN